MPLISDTKRHIDSFGCRHQTPSTDCWATNEAWLKWYIRLGNNGINSMSNESNIGFEGIVWNAFKLKMSNKKLLHSIVYEAVYVRPSGHQQRRWENRIFFWRQNNKNDDDDDNAKKVLVQNSLDVSYVTQLASNHEAIKWLICSIYFSSFSFFSPLPFSGGKFTFISIWPTPRRYNRFVLFVCRFLSI